MGILPNGEKRHITRKEMIDHLQAEVLRHQAVILSLNDRLAKLRKLPGKDRSGLPSIAAEVQSLSDACVEIVAMDYQTACEWGRRNGAILTGEEDADWEVINTIRTNCGLPSYRPSRPRGPVDRLPPTWLGSGNGQDER